MKRMKEQQRKIIFRLINDERKNKRLLSARGCINQSDYCPGTYSDLGMCPIYSNDICYSYDSGSCSLFATDVCKYDYAGCDESVSDDCITDYYSGCERGDICYVDND